MGTQKILDALAYKFIWKLKGISLPESRFTKMILIKNALPDLYSVLKVDQDEFLRGDLERFSVNYFLPTIAKNKIRFRKASKNVFVVTVPHFDEINIEKQIILLVGEKWTEQHITFIPSEFEALLHDSVEIDNVMVEELMILKQSDEKLLYYINHQWKYELLKKDFLQRLKNNN